MKKAVSIILALVLCLSLCACGGGNDTPETTEAPTETTAPESTMLSNEELDALAVPFTEDDISDFSDNKALAATFVGNVYSFEGVVNSVQEDHVVFDFLIDNNGKYYNGTDHAKVYLPTEELIELEQKQRVQVVGLVSSVSGNNIIFENAYIEQYYEITAILKGENHSYEGSYNIKIGDSNYLKLVYFAKDIDLNGINTDGDEITFLAKVTYNMTNGSNTYFDAIIP